MAHRGREEEGHGILQGNSYVIFGLHEGAHGERRCTVNNEAYINGIYLEILGGGFYTLPLKG
jgi:hypothetical protein